MEERAAVHEADVLHAVLAARVVPRAQARVREHLVRLADLLEARRGLGVVGVLVGVQLERELVVRLLDLPLGRVGRHAEQLVVLAVRHGLVAAAAAAAAALAALAAALVVLARAARSALRLSAKSASTSAFSTSSRSAARS